MTLNRSDSTWLKIISELVWPSGGFYADLGVKAGILLKYHVSSFQKFHLVLMEIGAKPKPLLSFFITAWNRTLWLKLKISSE